MCILLCRHLQVKLYIPIIIQVLFVYFQNSFLKISSAFLKSITLYLQVVSYTPSKLLLANTCTTHWVIFLASMKYYEGRGIKTYTKMNQ